MGTMAKVVVLPEKDLPLRVEELELPEPTPYQVVVQQFSSGICHSQLHQMHATRSAPVVLGHEATGVVTAVGSAVTETKVGDRVMVTWVPRRPDMGRTVEAATLPLGDGSTAVSQNVFTWADTTVADEAYLVPLPDWAPTDVTSIIGCAVMTGAGAVARTVDLRAGDSVAIFGVGGVGLSAVAAAAAVGADPVIAVDLDASKLELARGFGATHVVDASQVDAVQAIRDLTRRPGERDIGSKAAGGVDFAFDCIGVPVTMTQILQATRYGVLGRSRGGVAVLVGVPRARIELDTLAVLIGEKTYRGSHGGSCVPEQDFPMLLRWYQQGKLDLDRLVTRRFSIDEINEATAALEKGQILGRSILVFEH